MDSLSEIYKFRVTLTTQVKHYFKCNRCGLCCKGSVELTPREYDEIVKLAEKLRVKVPIEVRDYVTHIKIILRPIEDQQGEKWCVFLRREDSTTHCMIYDKRPVFCRLFPLYMGVSNDLKTIYVDVIHCPEVRHTPQEEHTEVNEEFCTKIILESIEYNSEVLLSVPDLDKDVIVFELGDVVAIAKLYNKYMLVKSIGESILQDISEKSTWLELLEKTLALQYAVRDIVSVYIVGRKRPEDLAEIVRELLTQARSRMKEEIVSDAEVMYLAQAVLSDIGLKIDRESVAVHDAKNITIRAVKLDNAAFNTPIGKMIVYIEEILSRLPTFYQILHLPVEIVFSHGYFPIFVAASVYSNALADLDIDSKIASIDMGALPYVFKYVTALARSIYASHLGKSYIEVKSLI